MSQTKRIAMTIEQYRAAYVQEIMDLTNLSKEEAEECFEALNDETLAEQAAEGNPAYDAQTEVSYWDD